MVAQIYGASLYYVHQKGIDKVKIIPVIITTFELSPEARKLEDKYQESNGLVRYLCIKCNVVDDSGERNLSFAFRSAV